MVLLIGRWEAVRRGRNIKITSPTLLPLLFHPFLLDDPVIITDNKSGRGSAWGWACLLLGGSVGASVAHSKLLIFETGGQQK